MNKHGIQQNGINTDTTKHYEPDEEVVMIFHTVGNETGNGGKIEMK